MGIIHRHLRTNVLAIFCALTATSLISYGCGGGGGGGGVGETNSTVGTLPATSVGATTATLNGNVSPNGLATIAGFEWGTDSVLSAFTSTPSQSVGSGTTSQPVSAALTGLSTGTTYFYRVVGTNDSGTTRGSVVSFTPGGDIGITGNVLFLVIDEDSIDNGNPPNNFSAIDVNDQLADIGLREPLKWFEDNVGRTIDLYTGQVGDEGWFALKTIPVAWRSAGPTGNGLRNYLMAGPGLGGPPNREVLLDEIPDVTPLRATGLAMLTGQTVCALVYDSDVSINYSPLQGNLQGANLGLVAFEVGGVRQRFDGSSSDLPRVSIVVRDTSLCNNDLYLFINAPTPASSSEPFDIAPPATPEAPQPTKAP